MIKKRTKVSIILQSKQKKNHSHLCGSKAYSFDLGDSFSSSAAGRFDSFCVESNLPPK